MNDEVTHGALDDINRVLSGDIDLFICSASFEDRCLSIAGNLSRARIRHALIAMNSRFEMAVDRNYERLRALFAGKETTMLVDSMDPVFTTANTADALRKLTGTGSLRIVIDITTFTHEALLILFRLCDLALDRSNTVDFVYATAGEYSLGDKPSEKWLSKGISEVRSVMGYAGVFVPSRRTHLVILAGFEDYRALNLVREVEPALVSIGYGDRSERGTRAHQDANERSVERIRRLIRNLVGNVEEFVFACYDSRAAQRAIEKALAAEPKYNGVVAPMNTKISTLGAGRVALHSEAVQVCYAQADTYNFRRYSRPGTEFYRLRFSDYPVGLWRGL